MSVPNLKPIAQFVESY